MGITSFADISRKEFLKIYLGIEDSSVLEDKGDSFSAYKILDIEYWKMLLHRILVNSWKAVEYVYDTIFLFSTLSHPSQIDWREKVSLSD